MDINAPERVDLETRIRAEHPDELRLWLRLLACTQWIERDIRSRLRTEFDTTLPRFDFMAQLERFPDGLYMSELSHRMMVTGGNVTAITDQLEAAGWAERVEVTGDRRATRVRLTSAGSAQFRAMAQVHEGWVEHAFSSLSAAEIAVLHQLLGKVRRHFLETT